MGKFNDLLSGLVKDAMDNITSTVKDKIEDVFEDTFHPGKEENITINVTEAVTIESLYHRLGEMHSPMTGEEFIDRMQSAGFAANLIEIPEEKRKLMPVQMQEIFKHYLATKDTPLFHVEFKVYKEEADATKQFISFKQCYKNSQSSVLLLEEEDRFFQHQTMVMLNDAVKIYDLYSRIGNTLLQVSIPEDNADAYATDIVKALQGTGY